MAAKPNEPPMRTLRKWIAALEQAIDKDDRATIEGVLKDAVPDSVHFANPATASFSDAV